MGEPEKKPDTKHEFRAVHAFRDALPTRRHAEMLFDMVVDLLGAEAWVETMGGETTRTLFRREAPGSKWILPWPLLSLTMVGRDDPNSPTCIVPLNYEEPAEPEPRPGKVPKLRGLGAGEVSVHDGPMHLTVNYGKDGRWFETSRSASPDDLFGVVGALEAKNAPPVELVAAFVAGIDLGHLGPGRVHLPVAVPGGARGSWNCGRNAIREALFRERVPRAARWVATDGWTGRAVAWGATRDAAMDAWRDEVARTRPFPEKPKPPAELPPQAPLREIEPEDPFGPKPLFGHDEEEVFSIGGTIRGPSSDVPWVEPTVENSPAVALPLGDLPTKAPSLGSWTWLVGGNGAVVPAALRLEPEGFTLVGDRLIEVLNLKTLESCLAQADLDAMPRPEPPPELAIHRPPTDSCVRTYRLVDEKTGKPEEEPKIVGQGWCQGFQASGLDGDQLRWFVVRLQRDSE